MKKSKSRTKNNNLSRKKVKSKSKNTKKKRSLKIKGTNMIRKTSPVIVSNGSKMLRLSELNFKQLKSLKSNKPKLPLTSRKRTKS